MNYIFNSHSNDGQNILFEGNVKAFADLTAHFFERSLPVFAMLFAQRNIQKSHFHHNSILSYCYLFQIKNVEGQ
jgi:hypothetical protein